MLRTLKSGKKPTSWRGLSPKFSAFATHNHSGSIGLFKTPLCNGGLAKVLPNIIGMLGSHNLSCSLCGRTGTSCLVLFSLYWPGWMYRGMGWLGSQRHHVNILWWRWKPCRPQELQTTTGKWRVHSGSEGSLHSQKLCFWNQPVRFSVELSSRARPNDPTLEICWTTSQDRFHKDVPTQGTGATWNYHMPLGWSHLKRVTIRYSWPGLEYPPFSVAVDGYPGGKTWFSTSRCTAGCSGCKALGDHVLVPSFQQTASLVDSTNWNIWVKSIVLSEM